MDALHRLFVGTDSNLRNNPLILQGGHWADEALRNAFHQALHDITESPAYQNALGQLNLVSMAGMNAQSVATLAAQDTADGLAYRFALEQMNPFVLTGDASLYAAHNADGHLDAGQFSNLYLQDRAAMLSWVLDFNGRNAQPVGDTFVKLGQGVPYYFEDENTNTKIRLGMGDSVANVMSQPMDDFRHIVFGSNHADIITGQSKIDRLYGGSGADTITGGGGNDYLEGGTGFDTYVVNTGDGNDAILDTDGDGVVQWNGLSVHGKTGVPDGAWQQLSPNSWRDGQNGFTYWLIPGAQGDTLKIGLGDMSLTLRDWEEGELGITLGSGAPAVTDLTLQGDLAPLDQNPGTPGVQIGYDALGNVLVGTEAEPHRADTLYDSAGNDLLLGLGGNDRLLATRGGDDRLEGGDGHDVMNGGAGNDTLLGGSGSDVMNGDADNDLLAGGSGSDALQGGVGHDQLYAHEIVDLDTAWLAGEAPTTGHAPGDWLAGQGGDDILVGGAADDVLLGGENGDVIFAGPGHDYLTTGEGEDAAYGGSGNDWIVGEGTDFLDGGQGDDYLVGIGGNSHALGGHGNDYMAAFASERFDLLNTLVEDEYLNMSVLWVDLNLAYPNPAHTLYQNANGAIDLSIGRVYWGTAMGASSLGGGWNYRFHARRDGNPMRRGRGSGAYHFRRMAGERRAA